MTHYCPTCKSEYRDSIKKCPDDGTLLTTHRPKPAESEMAVDVYAAAGEVEAERIVTFLASEGIAANKLQRGQAAFPLLSDTHFVICVQKPMLRKAAAAIQRARSDQVISDTGVFLAGHERLEDSSA